MTFNLKAIGKIAVALAPIVIPIIPAVKTAIKEATARDPLAPK